ncbi:hypothetical protein [Tropicimonas sp. S265A]|uniref:hypothetical protein n=1 Tax=Tropicimonas sp. S265A TaxID=3415134 RepID=UPI003C7DE3F6
MLDGVARKPANTSVSRYTDLLSGSSLSLEFGTGPKLPGRVTLVTGSGAILANGKAISLPEMTFDRAVRTTTSLVQSINC